MVMRFIGGVAAVLGWAGIVINNVVKDINGGMPFPSAYALGHPTAWHWWVPITPHTKFPWLADTLQTSLGLMSIGDVLIMASLSIVIVGTVVILFVRLERRLE